jgi:flagellin
MPLIINTNVSSINSQRNLTNNTNALSKSLEKLSSGYKINRAADDAAGLQISEILRAQVRGQQKAMENTQTTINVLNIADGSLATMEDHLQRIRELTVQAGNDSNNTDQLTAIESEVNQRLLDIQRIAQGTQFNGRALLDGSLQTATFFAQVGANSAAGVDALDLSTAFANMQTGAGGAFAGAGSVGASVTFTDTATARAYIDNVDAALTSLNNQRSTIGAFTNRLESVMQDLANSIENNSAAESTIRNVDIASESANMTKSQILQQASASMLAQANSAPQLALKLLG